VILIHLLDRFVGLHYANSTKANMTMASLNSSFQEKHLK